MAKKLLDTRTPEEIAISRLTSTDKELSLIPEPNRFFEVGDDIEIGFLKDCKIKKKLLGGKAYLIEYTAVDNNYGKPIIKKGEMGAWAWTEIFKRSGRKESFVEDEDIQLNYYQTGMSGLLTNLYCSGVDMNPQYQRDYVWSEDDKAELIDSIFKNVDIGKFVFVELGYNGKFCEEVLDGKQRLNTIKEFYEDRFLYKGLKFSELSIKDRSHFTNLAVNVCKVSECNLKMKLRIFYKLNTSGKVMDKEHLQKIRKMIDDANCEVTK